MVQAIDILHGPEAAYDWVVSHWRTVKQYLWTKSSPVYSRASRTAVANLRNTLMRVVKRIENPGNSLTERIRTRPDGPWKKVGEYFIDALCALQLPEGGDAEDETAFYSTLHQHQTHARQAPSQREEVCVRSLMICSSVRGDGRCT